VVRTLAPDGRWMSVTGSDTVPTTGWAFVIWVNSWRGSFRIHTGDRGAEERAHEAEKATVVTREAAQQGNRLVSLEVPERGGTTLIWQGQFHEISLYLHRTRVPMEFLIHAVQQLDLTDSRDGIVVRAAKGSGVHLNYTLGVNVLADLCGVDVRATAAAPELPAAAGKPVRGGRMWRSDRHGDDGRLTRRRLMIANDSTLTTLTPFAPDDARMPALAESIDVRLG
jgi:hypothetical protein